LRLKKAGKPSKMLAEFVQLSLEEALQVISQANYSETGGRDGEHSGLKRLPFWRAAKRVAPVRNHLNAG
jgi:hypothetical protein